MLKIEIVSAFGTEYFDAIRFSILPLYILFDINDQCLNIFFSKEDGALKVREEEEPLHAPVLPIDTDEVQPPEAPQPLAHPDPHNKGLEDASEGSEGRALNCTRWRRGRWGATRTF